MRGVRPRLGRRFRTDPGSIPLVLTPRGPEENDAERRSALHSEAVEHPVITLDGPSQPPGRPQRSWIHSRRFVVAGGLAVAEVIAYLVLDPSRWLGIVVVGALLAGCIALSGRLKPGFGRDVVLIAALAQAMLIALPIMLGFVQLVLATFVVFLLIAVFVTIGLRFRR